MLKVCMRGIIYSATGAQYAREAVTSATSSLRFNQIPHLIFCDVPLDAQIAGLEYCQFSSCGNPFLDKINNIRRSPFIETIFLDTDTYVLGNLDEVFDLLKRFDLAAAHTPGYTKGPDFGQSEAFYDFNTGVIAYRTSGNVLALLDNWEKAFLYFANSPDFRQWLADQHAFRRVIWESAAAFYVLPPEYNCRIQFHMRLVGAAKILHGRSLDYEANAKLLNAERGARVFARVPTGRGLYGFAPGPPPMARPPYEIGEPPAKSPSARRGESLR